VYCGDETAKNVYDECQEMSGQLVYSDVPLQVRLNCGQESSKQLALVFMQGKILMKHYVYT